MRHFFFPRSPLRRGTLLFCHAVLQFGVLGAGLWWLAPRTPWLAPTTWADAWPTLAIGASLTLAAMVGLRLIAELWLLPHHLADQRPGFAASDVVTRSFERRPAVHDEDQAWTSQARAITRGEEAVGSARVTRPAEPLGKRRVSEPGLNLNERLAEERDEGQPQDRGDSVAPRPPQRREPSL